MQLIDSHCHLDFTVFDNDRNQLLEDAKQSGIETIIVPAVTQKKWHRVQSIKQQYAMTEVAYGLHPYFMQQHKQSDLIALREILKENNAIAVGECGLDFFIKSKLIDEQAQVALFIEHLKLASEFSLPVIIHARKSLDIILKYLRKYPELKGVIHSFSGSLQQAKICIDQGFLLGFGGSVTYTRANNLRKLAVELPLEKLLLETDAPDQPDSQHKGQRNVPANLLTIATVIAELRSCELSEIAHQTTQNAKDLFNLTHESKPSSAPKPINPSL